MFSVTGSVNVSIVDTTIWSGPPMIAISSGQCAHHSVTIWSFTSSMPMNSIAPTAYVFYFLLDDTPSVIRQPPPSGVAKHGANYRAQLTH